MALEHEDLILLARLLGNHLNGERGPLTSVAEKLMDYAERTGVWDMHDASSLPPLKLALGEDRFYPGQLMFCEADAINHNFAE